MLTAEHVGALLCETGEEPVLQLLARGYTFPQAVERLAGARGSSLGRLMHQRQPENEMRGQMRLLALVEQAASFYQAYLWRSPSQSAADARAYLQSRRIHPTAAAMFRLGASPEDGGLARRMAQQGVQPVHLALAGLGYDTGGDVFRGRLMLPVFRSDGKVAGFGARNLRDDQPGGKYINSPSCLVFDKGHALFTPPGVRAACLSAGYVVLVEGYLDVIAMWQHGFSNVCAIMGTAASRGQVVRLAALARTVVIALDPDLAGERASLQAAATALDMGLDVRVAELRGGDPDELLAMDGGVEYIRHAITSSHPFVPVYQEVPEQAQASYTGERPFE